MKLTNFALALFCAVSLLGCASLHDLPPELQQKAECMLAILKATPGVSGARLGVSTRGGWTHPFLEYRADEKTRWVQPTRFDLQKRADRNLGKYWFLAILPGLTAVGEDLDFHVTDAVVKAWKDQSGVQASILTV